MEDHTAAGEFSAEQTAYVICRPFLRERPIFLARPRRTDFIGEELYYEFV